MTHNVINTILCISHAMSHLLILTVGPIQVEIKFENIALEEIAFISNSYIIK